VEALAEARAFSRAWSLTENTTDSFDQNRCAEHLALAHARKRSHRSTELVISEWCTESNRSHVWFAVAQEYVRSGRGARRR